MAEKLKHLNKIQEISVNKEKSKFLLEQLNQKVASLIKDARSGGEDSEHRVGAAPKRKTNCAYEQDNADLQAE